MRTQPSGKLAGWFRKLTKFAGEVSAQQLSDAIVGPANNLSIFDTLTLTVSDPPAQSEVQAVVDKLNELINALKRW